jgi:hypothetical protein
MIYNLKSLINRTDNPLLGGLFEFGFMNVSDPDYPVGFNRLSDYGYTDGTTVNYSSLDISKLLAWNKQGNVDIHTGIAFENLSSSLIQQPFDSANLIYANLAGGVLSHGRKNICVRVHITKPSLLSMFGGIQRSNFGCSTNVGYSIIKNGNTPIIGRTELITTTQIVTFTTGLSQELQAGDYVDFIIDTANDNNIYCDTVGFNLSLDLVQADTVAYIDDAVLVDVPHTLDLMELGAVCDTGVTTFELVSGSETNVQVTAFSPTGTFTFVPTNIGTFGFTYKLKCDGIEIGIVLIRGVAYCVPTNSQITTTANSVLGSTVVYSAVPSASGTWTVNNGASIISGQSSNQITVQLPNTIKKITVTFTYIDCERVITRTRIIAMTRPACIGDC